jgi:two-component system phosphate regulon sensor histidine kinase PhoR
MNPGAGGWWTLALGLPLAFLLGRGLALRRIRRESRRLADSIDHLGDATSATGPFTAVSDPLAPIAGAALRSARRLDGERRESLARIGQLEAIFRSSDRGLLALDRQHRILELNPAAEAILGVSAGTARGRMVEEVARQPELHAFLVRSLAADAESSDEAAFASRSGGPPATVRLLARPLRDRDGRSVGLLVSLEDITRLKRLEDLRTDFVANVSHELRTPITAIKGYVETLLEVEDGDPATGRRFLETIRRNTARLANLVEDLLRLASLDATEAGPGEDPRGPLEFESVPVGELVAAVLEQVGPVAEARRVELRTDLAPELRVSVNRLLAEQALFNLVSNAIRYGGEGKPVDLATRREGELVTITVRDRGPGIAPKHLPRIFERFYRVDKARTRADGGTGLGLAIVKHIAMVHGGGVEASSTLGAGSEFRIRFPVVADRGPFPPAREPNAGLTVS